MGHVLGKIHHLYDKWWKQIGAVNCEAKSSDEGESMNIENVGGIFFFLIFGIVISVLVGIIEYMWKIKKAPYEVKLFIHSV